MYENKFERIECQPKLSIYENNIGYTPNMEGYATFMSDMPELSEISHKRKAEKSRLNCMK